MQHFTKIPGYKVISKCRNCGSRIVGKSETYYCEGCLARLRAYRETEAIAAETIRVAVKKEAARKEAKRDANAAAKVAAKKATPKKPVTRAIEAVKHLKQSVTRKTKR